MPGPRRRGPAPSTALVVAWWFPPLGLVMAVQSRSQHPPGSRGRSMSNVALLVGTLGTLVVVVLLAVALSLMLG